jgi:hypothetical protein
MPSDFDPHYLVVVNHVLILLRRQCRDLLLKVSEL